MRRGVLGGAVLVAGLAALGVGAGVAAAGTLRIAPLALRSSGAPLEGRLTPGGMSGAGPASSASYWHPLRLPAGSVLTRIAFLHRGAVGQVSTTSVLLMRGRFGEMAEQLAAGSSSDSSGQVVEAQVGLGSPVRLERGYRYWLVVGESNWFGTFLGAKVRHR